MELYIDSFGAEIDLDDLSNYEYLPSNIKDLDDLMFLESINIIILSSMLL